MQSCRPRLTKSLEKNKRFGCMMRGILGKISLFGCMMHIIFGKQAYWVHDAQNPWTKNTSSLGARGTKSLEKSSSLGCTTRTPRCDGSPNVLDSYSPLHPKQVRGRIVKKDPTDLCLHAPKRRGGERERERQREEEDIER